MSKCCNVMASVDSVVACYYYLITMVRMGAAGLTVALPNTPT